jgi:hypothetical protein
MDRNQASCLWSDAVGLSIVGQHELTWSRLSACHDGFLAGVRPRPAVICGLGHPFRPEGISFDVPAHALKLISYPMIIVAHAADLRNAKFCDWSR